MFKLSTNAQIFLAALSGIITGLLFQVFKGHALTQTSLYVCGLIGSTFIDLLKMVLIPLVLTSIAAGIANLRAHDSIHQVWKLTLAYFLTATTLATLLGLFTANVFKPGKGLNIDFLQHSAHHFDAKNLSLSEFFQELLHHSFMNPIAAMAQGEILATVVFALFLGVAFVISGDKSKHLLVLTQETLDLMMLIISWIMKIAPIGIFALLAKLVSTQSIELFAGIAKFIAVVLGGTLFHGFVTLPLLLFLATRIGPVFFFRGAREALVTAFATSSSSATLPVTMRCSIDHLGVDKQIANFVPPLGATLNMDGTALYEAATALFVANLIDVDLNLAQQTVVCLTAILASIGAPGIPSAGMVTMIMVLQSVGLPAEAIAILLPIDRILDTVRTMVNVEGDMIGSLIVQKLIKNPSK